MENKFSEPKVTIDLKEYLSLTNNPSFKPEITIQDQFIYYTELIRLSLHYIDGYKGLNVDPWEDLKVKFNQIYPRIDVILDDKLITFKIKK